MEEAIVKDGHTLQDFLMLPSRKKVHPILLSQMLGMGLQNIFMLPC